MRAFLTAGLVLLAVGARAQRPGDGAAPPSSPAPGPMLGGGCVNQMLSRLCGGATLGSPEFAACSQHRLGEASAACQPGRPDAAVAASRPFDPKDPCKEDRIRLCDGKPNEPSYAPACLRAHRAELNPACAASPILKMELGDPNAPQPVAPKPHFRQVIVFARCTDKDAADFCADVPKDAVDACLEEHEAEVPERCRLRIADTKRKRRIAAACKTEIAGPCSSTADADAAIVCLGRLKTAASTACRASLAPRKDD